MSDGGTVAQFAELQAYLKKEDYDHAITHATKMMQKLPNDEDLSKVLCVSLIRKGEYQRALTVANKIPCLAYETAYCLYKLKKLEDASQHIQSVVKDEWNYKHLAAQLYYRLEKYDKAIDIYQELLKKESTDPTDVAEIQTNLIAAFIAAGQYENAFEFLDQNKLSIASYELQYNLGTAAALAGDYQQAEKMLRDAETKCREILKGDGFVNSEIDNEAAVILVQLAFVLQKLGSNDRAASLLKNVLKSKPSDEGVVAVASNNLAVVRRDKDLAGSCKRTNAIEVSKLGDKLTSAQTEAILLNKALLLSALKKDEECKTAVAAYEKLYPSSEVPVLITASALLRERKFQEAVDTLKKKAKTPLVKLALAQSYIAQGHIKDAIAVVESIESIQHSPATVATLVNLYDELGDIEGSIGVFKKARAWRSRQAQEGGDEKLHAGAAIQEAEAEYLLSHGRQKDAAASYRQLIEGGVSVDPSVRLRSLAALVIATSYYDSKTAEIESARLPGLGEPTKDPEDLEHGYPRAKKARTLLGKKVLDATEGKQDRKRKAVTKEKVMRKRARRREEYLQRLVAKGAITDVQNPPRVDPERWIPRKQRSYAKRGRKARGKFVGAQGAGLGTDADAHKFDAAARAAEKKAQADKKPEAKVAAGSSAMERRAKARKRR